MATEVLVSVDEYLRTGYRPDYDYLDGEFVPRNLGEFEHSRAQREILFFLGMHYPELRERLFASSPRKQSAKNRNHAPGPLH